MMRTIAAAACGFLLSAAGPSSAQTFDMIDRGRAVAIASDCVACHTAPGGKPFAGGLALATPFGKLLASNITPDHTTGIGLWSPAELGRAVRDGLGRNGRNLYPAMPYPAYSKMTDRDLAALAAYLSTVEPVENEVVTNQLNFPFGIRRLVEGWNLLNFDGGSRFEAEPSQSAEWNRGAYLVDTLGHCGMCHTPKSILGADKGGQPLMGAVLEGWVAPNITADDRRGIGAWSKDEIVAYLKTGANSKTIAAGPMMAVVANSTSLMPDTDLRAIATFLLKAKPAALAQIQPIVATDGRMVAGAAIYRDTCAACHVGNGQGAPGLFPRLSGNAVVQQDDPATLIRVVLAGAQAIGTDKRPTAPAMPALGWRLDDPQVAAVLTYLRNAWGNAAAPVSASDVQAARHGLLQAGLQ